MTAHWFESDDGILDAMRAERSASTLVIPGYADLCELTRGGQGVVYLGVERETGRRVAVKVLRDEMFVSPQDRRRFEREVDLASALHHPNVVPVIDHGVTDGNRRFLAMPYVQGHALDEHVLGADRRRWARAAAEFDPDAIVRLVIGVCDGVAYAHQRGVIHRDLKPANVRVDQSGVPRVLDFGMALPFGARARARDREPTTTLTGQFVGSLAWASPEQVESDGSGVDVRSDVHALGLILYVLLTGRFPYDVAGSLRQTLDNIVNATPIPPSRWRPVDADLEAIVLRCLRKDPDDRYPGVADLGRDLRCRRDGEPIEMRREGAWRRLQQNAIRYRRTVAASVTVVVALTVLCGTLGVMVYRTLSAEWAAEDHLRQSRQEAERSRRVMDFMRHALGSVNVFASDATVPTMRSLLDTAARRIDVDLAGQPEPIAVVAMTIGRAYYNLGALDEAEPLLRRSVVILRDLLAEVPPGTRRHRTLRQWLAETLEALGVTVQGRGRYDEAEPLLAESRRLYEMLGQSSVRDQVRIEVDQAVLLAAQGRLGEAEGLLLAALDRAQTRRDPVGGLAAHRLGQIAAVRGDQESAGAWYRRAHAQLERYAGPGSLPVADTMVGLAEVANAEGRWSDATSLAGSAREIYRSRVGRQHVRIADCLLVMGRAATRSGRPDEADGYYREAVAMCHATVGGRHHSTAHATLQRANHLVTAGRLDEAEPLMRESLSTFRSLHAPEHPDVGSALKDLGCLLVRTGRPDEARPMLRDARVILAEAYGDGDPRVREAGACLSQAG